MRLRIFIVIFSTFLLFISLSGVVEAGEGCGASPKCGFDLGLTEIGCSEDCEEWEYGSEYCSWGLNCYLGGCSWDWTQACSCHGIQRTNEGCAEDYCKNKGYDIGNVLTVCTDFLTADNEEDILTGTNCRKLSPSDMRISECFELKERGSSEHGTEDTSGNYYQNEYTCWDRYEKCHYEYCGNNTVCYCDFGEGNCKNDDECEDDLICGQTWETGCEDVDTDLGCDSDTNMCVECCTDEDCSEDRICEDYKCIESFDHKLQVNVSGEGSVEAYDYEDECTEDETDLDKCWEYNDGDDAVVEASPEEEFKEWKCHEDGEWKSCDDVRWDEDIDINGNEAEVKMWDDRNVTAVFEREGVEEMNKLLVKLDGGGRISPDYDADGYIESCEDDEYADDYYDYCWWYVEESEAEIEAIGSGWTVVNLVGHRWRGREDYEWKDYGLLDWLYPANSDFEEFGVDMAGERRVRVAQHPQLEVDIYPDDVEDDVDVSVDGMEDCEPDKYDECWVMEHEIVAEPDLDYDEDKLELVGWEGEVTTSTPEGPASYFDDCENDDVDEWLDCDTGEVDTDKPRKVQAEFELSGDGTMEVKAEPEEGGDVDVEWEEEGETVQETVADEDTFTVMEGTDVDLEAKSATDWDFVEWQGDSDIQGDTSKNVQLTINPDHEATAVFETGDPYFDVDITDPQDGDEFEEGDTVTVDYEVGNVGGEDGTQDIEFKVDGTLEDTEEDVSISSGDTYTDSFTWTPGSEGDHTLSVHSDDDSDDVTVGVIDPGDPYFDVDITDPQDGDEFEEGDTVTVDYEVGNVGGEDGTQDIEFKVDGTLEDTEEDVSISSGDTYTDSFTWTPGSEGDHTLSVHSDDDSDDVTVGIDGGTTESDHCEVRVCGPGGACDTITVEC